MIKNYITIAFRKFLSNKVGSFIKVISLLTGIFSLFYISAYIHEELSFDGFHSQKQNIYCLNTRIDSPTGTLDLALTATPVASYLKSNSPSVKDFVRINKEYGSHTLRAGDRLFSESENIYYADPSFLQFFDFELLSGNRLTALQQVNNVIISKEMSEKYFGDKEALNSILQYDGEPFVVSGVLENVPSNTQFQFDFLISMETFLSSRPSALENWTWFPMNTYLLVDGPENIQSVEEIASDIPQYLSGNLPNEKYTVYVEPFENLHFSESKLGELSPKGNMSNIYILFMIGILIMVLAVFNYVNLSVAQLSTQYREVTVKKTLGANRIEIFYQYFIESFLTCLFAVLLGGICIYLSLPWFERFMGHPYDLSFFNDPYIITLLICSPLILAIFSGVYPAFRFSGVSPISILRFGNTTKRRFFNPRTVSLVFQFTIASILMISSYIMYNQLAFIQNKDLGFKPDQMLAIDFGPNSGINRSYQSLKNELSQVQGVQSVTFSSHTPGQIPNGVYTRIVDQSGQIKTGDINLTLIDYDFIESYGLQIIAGRGFSSDRLSDTTSALILNEAAVKAFGYENPEDILGASYEQWGGDGVVIGVVKDFNYLSLHNDVGLLSLKMWPKQFQKISLKLDPSHLQATLTGLEAKWKSMYPDVPIQYYFVNDDFNKQYEADQRFTNIMAFFTIISISIGVLGLVAFATFWCERRRKEISIRKVFGADSMLLIWSLMKGFGIPVIVSFALAIPASFYLGRHWLQQFAYQITLDWTLLVIPLVAVLIFIWLSVGFQTLQTVLSNPSRTLRED